MARRKRQFLEDDDSDSASSDGYNEDFDETDPDLRAERELFADPYKNKRKRRNGKEDAIYGVFGSDDEEEGLGGRRGQPQKRSDWTKAPAFVSGDKVEPSKEVNESIEDDGEVEEEMNNEDEDSSDAMDMDGSEPSRPPSPRVRFDEDEEDAVPPLRIGGLGFGAAKTMIMETDDTPSHRRTGGIGFGAPKTMTMETDDTPSHRRTGGIGFGAPKTTAMNVDDAPPARRAGGIGFSSAKAATPETDTGTSTPASFTGDASSFPTAFGGRNRAQRAFVREDTPTARAKSSLSATEAAHFSKISGTFGARMLEKMGWQTGTGLGTSGEGIVTPIESKLRPNRTGIAFRGFKEKTDQSKAEARRRGEAISDDEDDTGARTRKGKAAPGAKKEEAWKRPKKAKTKVEHKTYEQVLAEAGEELTSYSGVGQIIDATGATPREVSSLAEVSMASWTPSSDTTRIPEVRHNLRLIVDASKSDLDSLAREAKALEERKKMIALEEARLGKKVQDEAELIARLQQVHLVADDINSRAKEQASMYEVSLDTFTPSFDKLLAQYTKEYERYHIDEIVVAAIAPIFRRMLGSWDPLEDPTAFTPTLRSWRGLLKTTAVAEPRQQLDLYGTRTVPTAPPPSEKPMTPYESLLWNAWMPKIRSVINNNWSPEEPQPLIRLYEAWASFLPPFVRDNFFDQLVLPKVQKAVADWNPRKTSVSLRTLVFPWLPHVGLRVESLLDDARRKIKSVLRAWTAADDVPADLASWKEVFDTPVWDNMILKYVVPKLGALLRDEFKVNPRQQDLAPIKRVFKWEDLLRPSILGSLLETGFFVQWLDVLHVWLVAPQASYPQIADWYTWWQNVFPESVKALSAVQAGFTQGQQLMHTALALGPNAVSQLPKPKIVSAKAMPAAVKTATVPKVATAPGKDVTFRDIVEEHAANHNLLFIPAGRVHEKSRMPLFKVTTRADGRGGLLVYVEDDAVWAADGDEWRAISLENMVVRAMKGA